MTNERLIPLPSKFAFGVGQFAEGLQNTGFGLFILFYYNQVLGLSGTLAGTAIFIALIFDAVTDPIAGSWSDNFKSRWGRRHPFMYASAIPLCLAFIGLFSPPKGLSEFQLFLWLAVFAVLTRGAMTLYHVPHLALGAEFTEHPLERTRIVAFRQFFSTFGGLMASGVGLGYFFSDAHGGRLVAAHYVPYAIVLGIMMIITIWYSALGTQSQIPFLLQAEAKPKRAFAAQLVSEVAGAFQNPSFRWLFLGVFIVFVMAGVNGSLNIYMMQYFWELTGKEMFYMQGATVVGLMAGVFFTPWLHRRASKRFGLVLGTAAWATFQVLPVVLRLVGWFPENHTMPLVSTLISMRLLQGFLLQQAFVSFGSMMADVADEHEYTYGGRHEGIFFGAISFSGKATSGFGNFIGGFGLDLIHWPRGANIKTAADIPHETLVHLGILFGPGVAAFAVVSVWCYANYKLTQARHSEILEALRERRAKNAADA